MLVIQKSQMEAITQSLQTLPPDFEERMIEHLRTIFRDKLSSTNDDELSAIIQSGIIRAEYYSISTERNIALLIDLLVGVSEDFDTAEQTRWIRSILDEEQFSEDVRIELIYKELPRRVD